MHALPLALRVQTSARRCRPAPFPESESCRQIGIYSRAPDPCTAGRHRTFRSDASHSGRSACSLSHCGNRPSSATPVPIRCTPYQRRIPILQKPEGSTAARVEGLQSIGDQVRSRSQPTASTWQHRIWSPPAVAVLGLIAPRGSAPAWAPWYHSPACSAYRQKPGFDPLRRGPVRSS